MVNAILRVFPEARVSSGYVRIKCPYHKDGNEKRPSMSILLEAKGDMPAGTCHCFACGTVVQLDELFKYVGVEQPATPESSRQTTPEKVTLTTTYSMYKPQLPFRFSPYLETRGIGEEVQRKFRIYEKESMVYMPVFDRDGKYLFVNSRSTVDKRYYVEGGAQKTLWGIEEANLSRPLIVCEGQIDAMSFWEAGYQAVATLGAGNIKALEAIKNMTSIVILAFDNDDSGNKAKRKAAELLGYFRCKYIEFPKGRDVNDLLVELGSEDLRKWINESIKDLR